jgi:hypothetical protein
VVNQAQAAYVQLRQGQPAANGAAGAVDGVAVQGRRRRRGRLHRRQAGQVALNNAADLYLYPNALHAVKWTAPA